MQRRRLITTAALAALPWLATLGSTAALAQGYPERGIKLVVPYAPGGSADIAARLIADEWGKALGSSMFIENKGGAGNLKELLAWLKAEPGKATYGSAGSGSTFHMSAELFKAVAGVPIVHIPYRGGGPALTDTIAGQVDMSFPVLSAARGHVQAGKLRALGVTGPKRSPLMPEVPTIAEAGLPGYSFETWFIVFAPAATPMTVLDKLNSTLNQVLASPAVKDRMVKEGFDPLPSTPAQARSRVEKEMPQWAKLIKERGITAD